MLTKLFIENYALIDELSVTFSGGLSTITGETGAGKSILLGALGLVLGNRADISSLKDSQKKCIVEAQFAIENYQLQTVFKELDLDYEHTTIIRREILPSGKSRSFVNDTPVTLSTLKLLKIKLMDIHSQHQTLALSDEDFQFSIVDALAKNKLKTASYKRGLVKLNTLKKELVALQKEQETANQQYEYNLHLFTELEEAKLQATEQTELEERLDKLNNVEDIKLNLSEALEKCVNEEIGGQTLLHSLENNLQKISSFSKEYETLSNRVTSIKIELNDIIAELENANEEIDFNPNELTEINDRLQLIYSLQKKHQVGTISELLEVYQRLSESVAGVENASEIIAEKQATIDDVSKKLRELAVNISEKRQQVAPKLEKKLKQLLSDLGMPNARFEITVKPTDTFLSNGIDDLSFLFAANKGGKFGELKKVASGGELSRIMLSVKKILSENVHLPTIIFDEIDTGVSGEISNKIATIMQQMGTTMQVITITHLPQIAAKGKTHYKVFKKDSKGITTSHLKQLTYEERTKEIAAMLSGKNISESALAHAKELLAS